MMHVSMRSFCLWEKLEKKNGTRLYSMTQIFLAKFIDEIVQKRYNNSTKNGKTIFTYKNTGSDRE